MPGVFRQLEIEWGLTRIYRRDLPLFRLTLDNGRRVMWRGKTRGEAVARCEAVNPGTWVLRAVEVENMASTAPEIPIELMRADAKYKLIEWIKATGLPSRFKRKLLQDWAVAVLVELNGTDYELVSQEGAGPTP